MTLLARRGRVAVLSALVLAGLAALGTWLEHRRPPLAGRTRTIDGDSLMVGGTEVRLYGIDAPELRQTCRRAEQPWACGTEAARALRTLIGGRDVACRARDRDRYGRVVAVCTAGGVELNAAMVKQGMAVAYGAYEADERDARDARRGLWSSSFDRPAAWRARHPR